MDKIKKLKLILTLIQLENGLPLVQKQIVHYP